jgi:hypothetical protein
MEQPLKAGQIVRFKNYKKKELETEAYFLVLITEGKNNDCWLQVINGNKSFETGTAIVPLYLDDFEVVEVQAKEFIYQQVTIKEGLYNDLVSDYVHSVSDSEAYIKFTAVEGGFESNVTYTMGAVILNGKLFAQTLNFSKL